MYGLRVRERLAPAHVLIACYANDYIGYLPTPDAETGYEVNSAIVAPRQASFWLMSLCAVIFCECQWRGLWAAELTEDPRVIPAQFVAWIAKEREPHVWAELHYLHDG